MELSELLKQVNFAGATTPEQITKAITDKATEIKAKVLVDDGEKDIYVPKARLDDEIGKKKSFKEDLDKVTKDLEALQKANSGNADLNKTIEDMKQTIKDKDEAMQKQSLDTAIKLKALEANAIDKTGADVLAFIDRSKLKLNDSGDVEGLDDAMKTLTEAKAYLFGTVPQGGTGKPGSKPAGQGGTPTVSIGESLAKQYAEANGNMAEARASFFK